MPESVVHADPGAQQETPSSPQQPDHTLPTPKTLEPAAQLPTNAQGLVPLLESVSKVAAGFLLAAYVSGYLTVSIYDSSFGFTELNPLKPKILAAGILFSVLIAIPVYAAHKIYSRPYPSTDSLKKVEVFLSRTVAYYYACSVTTTGMTLVISQKPEPGPLLKPTWILSTIFGGSNLGYKIALGVLSLVLFLLVIQENKLTKKHPGISIFSAILLLAVNLLSSLFSDKIYGSFWVELWFFGAGLVLRPLAVMFLNSERRKTTDWTKLVYIPIAALFFFARWVYPKVQASWGGGQPVPIVLYLTKESPLRPGESLPALLLDESESGFYFVEENKSQAVFMPRAQVSMLFFSNKPLPAPPPKAAPSPAEPLPQTPKEQNTPSTSSDAGKPKP